MSSKSRTLLLAFAAGRARRLVGVELRPLQPPHRPVILEFLRRQRDGDLHGGLHQPVRQLHGGAGGDCRRRVFRPGACDCRHGRKARIRQRRKRTGLHLRSLDRRSRVRPLSRLGVVRRSESVLHPVRDHVCLRDCDIHHLRWSHYICHDYTAWSRMARHPNADRLADLAADRRRRHRRVRRSHFLLSA